VRELLLRMDSRELSEWMAYEQIEPFGERRADLRSAIIACVIANAWRSPNRPPFRVQDFMPFEQGSEPITGEKAATFLRGILSRGNRRKPAG